jgi:hypothetical protein
MSGESSIDGCSTLFSAPLFGFPLHCRMRSATCIFILSARSANVWKTSHFVDRIVDRKLNQKNGGRIMVPDPLTAIWRRTNSAEEIGLETRFDRDHIGPKPASCAVTAERKLVTYWNQGERMAPFQRPEEPLVAVSVPLLCPRPPPY